MGIFSFIMKKKNSEKKFKNDLIVTMINLSDKISEDLKYTRSSEATLFGGDEVSRKLARYKNRLSVQFIESVKLIKKHEEIIKISDEVDSIISASNKIVSELHHNIEIDTTIRKNLDNKIESLERELTRAIPAAKDTISRINKDNPQSIWRGFNYSNFEREVESYIEKAKQLSKQTFNNLDMHLFDVADELSKKALKSLNNAYILVQSIFDVEKQLNASKEQYNRYISRLPELIADAKTAARTVYSEDESAKTIITDIETRYKELQSELTKGGQTIDWIVIGALVMSVVDGCKRLVMPSMVTASRSKVHGFTPEWNRW